ncbi:VOC family protein [Paracraurococcus ruber]|uniref:Glyoxalase/bleomycin resistance/dioxygenase family protein n=1 Tax=Paracraurococcus ruber TaxID=77675 RepID=A0ABS1CU67_9PROT|nr:VOC family protein [Paracraurococcus ruber]MBK1658035.1 glyoxalase/bleomycin resistance/dioxygenase family protein [Paracraurococcus ruber]TDG31747.1 glyoxalase/bleomycin resistance/dioxygenase family protein [Paracraurococcus ruber]
MKRLHVNLAVADLDATIRFYSGLFGAPPTVVKPDYAKWMLEDPRVNFAVSTKGVGGCGGRRPGLDHLGIQVEDRAELTEVYGRMRAADAPVLEQGAVTCCYAASEKSWINDPQGIAWEAFLTTGEATVYGDGGLAAPGGVRLAGSGAAVLPAAAAACCAPAGEGAA